MDAKRIIKTYISTRPASKIIAGVLAGAMVVLLVLFAVNSGGDDTATAHEFYPSDSPKGSYCYVDVVAVSDWLYDDGDGNKYYTIFDREGYLYIARIPSGILGRLDKQYEFFMTEEFWAEDCDLTQRESYRLYGGVRGATDTIKDYICQAWEITLSDYDRMFGDNYLAAGSSPSSDRAAWMFALSLTLGVFSLTFCIPSISANKAMKKSFARLDEMGLTEQAAMELEMTDNLSLGKDAVRFSDKFVFGKGTGFVGIYEDIEWCYKRVQRYNGIKTGEALVGQAKFINNFTLNAANPNKKGEDTIEKAMAVIAAKNPTVLLGFTGENIKAARDLRRERKGGGKHAL